MQGGRKGSTIKQNKGERRESMFYYRVINETMDLTQCRDKWTFDEKRNCWCLEDILYTPVPKDDRFQRVSIYVPKELLNSDGTVPEHARKVPVVFYNCASGYGEMPQNWLDSPRSSGAQYLERGWVFVSSGCRGRETRDEKGVLCGQSPATLVDFKTAIRFLRHNRDVLPGDYDQIISVGYSAGGAMSTLLAVTGDNENFIPYLEENGAFMEESDAVYAAQIYCPVTDLEHSNMAYEWMFRADRESEDSPAGPSEVMTPFQEALSAQLADRYVEYFNSMELKNPKTGELLVLNEDGRSGSGYDYFMDCLNRSATCYLTKIKNGELSEKYSPEDYIAGNYTRWVRGRPHIGPKGKKPSKTQGEMALRPEPGQIGLTHPPMEQEQGVDKRSWLSWDGERAAISSLDDYVLNHRRRMKQCPAFDSLACGTPENEVFGDTNIPCKHFDRSMARSLEVLKDDFPEEYGRYYPACTAMEGDADLTRKIWLYNPWNYIGTEQCSKQAGHYRVLVGGCDADTSFMISMTLALKLANAGLGEVSYGIVWDQPHCEADYPGEVCDWIESIRKK